VEYVDDHRRDSIHEEEFDLEQSRHKFERNMIDAHVTDFSARIGKLASYETYTVNETRQNKLKRLYMELREVEEEIENDNEPTDDLLKLNELYAKITKKTKELKINKLTEASPQLSSIPQSANQGISSKDIGNFQELETRISEIEKTIGNNFKPASSIQSIINDIFRKFKLLSNDKDELRRIESAIGSVNAKLEKSILTRRSDNGKTEISEDSKISEVYRNFQTFSNYSEELPLIIKRLESLNDLHTRSAHSINIAEELDHNISILKQDFDKWDDSLTKLESKLTDLQDSFEQSKGKASN
jgi:uncharacterized coiled-coil protein SlyX